MKQIESMRKLCALVSRIEDTDTEIGIFLHLYGYDERPDIVDPNADLIQTGAFVKFDAAIAKKALHKICEEKKENGHPEISVKAMELYLRLSDLEQEGMGQNTQ